MKTENTPLPPVEAFWPDVCKRRTEWKAVKRANSVGVGYGPRDFAAYNERAGFHWFKPDTMRYFRCRIGLYLGNGVFITSEQSPFGSRAYSVRVFTDDCQVETFGPFNQMSRSKAVRVARKLSSLFARGYCVIDSEGQAFDPPAIATKVE